METRILIVDDDPSIREIVKIMLKDYEVIEASNGREAVIIYKNLNPDIVLMDISMPEMDGVEATKEIMKINPKAVVIGLTAFSRTRGSELLSAGAVGIINKPFTRKILKETIERFLAKPVV
ncbi:MAG: response regulator [Archaeoglobales archaeon]|jgi:CheY-like chemotaxis protein|nr:response regulator [Archaeoglobi archaeon]NHW23835.1 response regulator [Archaeoglobales archaeon]